MDTTNERNTMDTTNITPGTRVRRIAGTSIEGLDGTVRLVDDRGALVALDIPEPGIGRQYFAPLSDLEVLPRVTPLDDLNSDGNAAERAADALRLFRFARFTQGLSSFAATERIAGLFGLSNADAGRLVGIGLANRDARGN